ncbi:uncharacterized protein PGTG_14807 [Puccinia graminis f. sp. tritici CRL 75-36-700-3]|uniref:Uncharacterized protein n=1 Tax=Puccinia graminis f. sp. tritici (strain CRL 75-36-700-3 / race SCCL) TaxID=418459 RepID=E3KWC7_PUCGT|nr:uncharacterized protein PGTG_14807 [Puccinia graminis f. sp. tritici CRL 75-36-700-3]EFP88602.2 hypothetical protein PGTG_14807 [Puccinia graminis f. sp. tritici CRL 75-36-700-3]
MPPGGIPPGKLVYNPACCEGIPPDELVNELVYIPACQEGFLPASLLASWYTDQLVGRDSFRQAGALVGRNPSQQAGVHTSSPGGWYSSRQAGVHTSSSGGVPPSELDFKPARQEESLPASWYTDQLVRRDSFQRAGALFGRNPSQRDGVHTSLPGGRASSRQAGSHTSLLGGVPPGELDFKPARQEESLPASWYTDQLDLEGIPSNELVLSPG